MSSCFLPDACQDVDDLKDTLRRIARQHTEAQGAAALEVNQ